VTRALHLANIEAGRLDLRLEVLDARKLVEEVVALFEDASSEHRLAVRLPDHGFGISEKDQKRIFEPFRRAGLSKESVPGVGLGLFVVRKIVEAHQGKIEVDSVLGAGSTFRVLLPRDELVVRGVTQPEDVSRVTH
jgi:signal transduction histidine kinase